MNRLEIRLRELNPGLYGKLNETVEQVKLFLNEYKNNFPQYTDHSIHHTTEVFNIVDEILTLEEINNLNDDEIYILSMASYLHDIGMCIPEEKISLIADTEHLIRQRSLHPEITRQDYLRSIHHTLSAKFIREEWQTLHIPSAKYADAIALVSEGHRVVELGNPDVYKPKYFVKTGRDFVCLPYLAALLRIADELDITNVRTPPLLMKYYMPDNDKSVLEWDKHIVNTIRNVSENYVRFEVSCSNYSMLASLEDQFNKIKNVLNYCQKIIKFISNTEDRKFLLKLEQVQEEYNYVNFDPKGIKYSFDVENVVTAFVGENLYNDKLTSLRELIQNSIDTCRYKKTINQDQYAPEILIRIYKDHITVEDNGLGMDEFIVKNFFSKLGSSYYQQLNVKKDYDAIGQFGVGVFSFFLMADYIDIETKTDYSDPLHFRLDRDPKNYFHFFPKSSRSHPGTTITMYLKKEFEACDSLQFVEYIKDKFRYIEFPINLFYDGDTLLLNSQSLRFENLSEVVQENLRYIHKEAANEIKSFTVEFDTKKYEGSITLLYLKDYSFSSVFRMFNETTNGLRADYNESLVEVSQKGVFVTNEERLSMDDTICKINLKEKLNIQISRNEFTNREELKILFGEINSLLINGFTKYLKDNNPKKALPKIIYNFFAQTHINYSYFIDNIKKHIRFIL